MDNQSRFAGRYKVDMSIGNLRAKVAMRKTITQKENRDKEFRKSRGLAQVDKNVSVKEQELTVLEEANETFSPKASVNKTAATSKNSGNIRNEQRLRLQRSREEKELRKSKEQREKARKGAFKCSIYRPETSLIPVFTSRQPPKDKLAPVTRVTRSAAKIEAPVDLRSRPAQKKEKAAEAEPEVAMAAEAEPEVAMAAEAEPEVAMAAEAEPEVAMAAEAEPEVAMAAEAEPEVAMAAEAEPEVAMAAEAEPEVAMAAEAEPEVAMAAEAEPEVAMAAEAEPEVAMAAEAEPEVAMAAEAEPEVAMAAEAEPEVAMAAEAEPEVAMAAEAEPEVAAEESGTLLEMKTSLYNEHKPSFAPENFVFQPLDGQSTFKFQPMTPKRADVFLMPTFTSSPVEGKRAWLESEVQKLTMLCTEWEKRIEQDIPEESKDLIRTVGQSRLLMTGFFKQFKGLVDNCESKLGGRETVTCRDLAGFWDLIYYQVAYVNKTFVQLGKMEENSWQQTSVQTKKVVLKKAIPAATVNKSQGDNARPAVRIRPASIEAAMTNKVKPEEVVEEATVSEQPMQVDPVVLDTGFFWIESPAKLPGGNLQNQEHHAITKTENTESETVPQVDLTPLLFSDSSSDAASDSSVYFEFLRLDTGTELIETMHLDTLSPVVYKSSPETKLSSPNDETKEIFLYEDPIIVDDPLDFLVKLHN